MFYTYVQNNSGGNFVNDDKVSLFVIIEADSRSDADAKALKLGIYFDGVDQGNDCPCCGDRWHSMVDSSFTVATSTPMIYDTPATDFNHSFANDSEVYCSIYYADGHIDRLTKNLNSNKINDLA